MSQKPFELDMQGEKIRGTVYLCEEGEGRRPAVVMLHGIGDDRIGASFMFSQLGRTLSERGIHAVSFDFRGSGESDGDFSQMLVSEQVKDAQRVLGWVRAQRYVDRSRVGLVGYSLGGLVGSCCAGEDLKSMVLIAPTTGENIQKRVTMGDAPVRVGPHALSERFFDDVLTLEPEKTLAAYGGAVMIIQGSDDKRVPGSVSRAYVAARGAAGRETKHVCVEGANHSFSSSDAREVLVNEVGSFLVEQL